MKRGITEKADFLILLSESGYSVRITRQKRISAGVMALGLFIWR